MIHVSALSKRFGDVLAVDNVSFSAAPAEPVAIVGPSGSGKTTLLRLLAGLETPDAGEICWTPAAPELRRVGVVFQEPALWPHMTALENVRFAVRADGRRESVALAREALRLTEAIHLETRRPAELSAGEAGRVALARALAAAPNLLLLDEPCAHFDPALQQRQVEAVLHAIDAAKPVVVWVTHDRDEAHRVSSRVYTMDRGRLAPA